MFRHNIMHGKYDMGLASFGLAGCHPLLLLLLLWCKSMLSWFFAFLIYFIIPWRPNGMCYVGVLHYDTGWKDGGRSSGCASITSHWKNGTMPKKETVVVRIINIGWLVFLTNHIMAGKWTKDDLDCRQRRDFWKCNVLYWLASLTILKREQ